MKLYPSSGGGHANIRQANTSASMTLPLLTGPRRMAPRAERFFQGQHQRQQRQRTLTRRTAVMLLAVILVIRVTLSNQPTVVTDESKQPQNEEHRPYNPKLKNNEKNKNNAPSSPETADVEEDLLLNPSGEEEEDDEPPVSTKPTEPRPPRVIRPIPYNSTLTDFQQQLFRQAHAEQDAFCENWKKRLTPDQYPNENFVPLVPSALEEISSLVHADQTFWQEVYPENDIVSNAILGSGVWEKEKVQRVQYWLQEYAKEHTIPLSNVTFVDIGANVGGYTFHMADLGVQVVAVEPMPSNLQLLRRSLCRNPHLASRVTLLGIGLTSSLEPNQTCTMYSHNINVGDGMTHCTTDRVPLKVPPDYEIRATIPMHPLDHVLGQLPSHQHTAVLKMDTEGYEGHVVAGGVQLFQSGRIPHIQSEYNPEWITGRGTAPRDYLTTFLNAGYRLRRDRLDPKTRREEGFLTRDETLNETILNGFNDVLWEN